MSSPRATPTARLAPLLVVLLALLLPGPLSLAAPAAADDAPRARGSEVISRSVVFKVRNSNQTPVLCTGDGDAYQVKARLVGPRRAVYGRAGSTGVNLLVHDAGTGGWFWDVQARGGRFSYAERLGARGELSLVLDRLGYDRSPLANGDDTCLGAQATVLHQIVQHLRSGSYRFTGNGHFTPAASFVTVHGHAQGSLVAEVEAAAFDDVDGLVLMSWADSDRSQRDQDESTRESNQCAGGVDFASYGAGTKAFRRLLLAGVSDGVRRATVTHRNRVPCGDVDSLTTASFSASQHNDEIEAPVLLLYGRRDARLTRGAAAAQRGDYDAAQSTTLRRYRGGSALPLGQAAPAVRHDVLTWLHRHVG